MGVYVGNDVVDLADPANAATRRYARFVERVCAPSERAALARAAAPDVYLWSLFAAKEAAYKVFDKLGRAPGFAHRRLVVAGDLRSVDYEDLRLHLWLDVDAAAGVVHALASTHDQRPWSATGTVEARGDPSLAVRELACMALAPVLATSPAELRVRRPERPGSWDGYGPPRLLRRDSPVSGVDISLSHDGRFTAVAAHLPEVVRATLAPCPPAAPPPYGFDQSRIMRLSSIDLSRPLPPKM